MKRIVIALAVVASILAGCESMRTGKSLLPFTATHPKIFINDENYIVVDQEPIVIPHGNGTVVVLWEIVTPDVTFDAAGITIEGMEKALLKDGNPAHVSREQLDRINAGLKAKAADKTSVFPCQSMSPTKYKCTIQRDGLDPGLYAYTVRVLLPGNIKRQLDPRLMY